MYDLSRLNYDTWQLSAQLEVSLCAKYTGIFLQFDIAARSLGGLHFGDRSINLLITSRRCLCCAKLDGSQERDATGMLKDLITRTINFLPRSAPRQWLMNTCAQVGTRLSTPKKGEWFRVKPQRRCFRWSCYHSKQLCSFDLCDCAQL